MTRPGHQRQLRFDVAAEREHLFGLTAQQTLLLILEQVQQCPVLLQFLSQSIDQRTSFFGGKVHREGLWPGACPALGGAN